jgi:hypothetical protein
MANAVKRKNGSERVAAGIGTIQVGNGTLEWYKVTEQTRYVLNNAIAGYMHQRLAEKRKPDSDRAAIIRLTRKINQIVRITRDPANFQSIPKMQQLMEQYSQ